jgi:uncharacterized YigZ family protein
MSTEFYYTIGKEGTAEFKDRGSRFIAYAFPIVTIQDFKKRLQELKEEHPKAAHHCFAYRIGTDGNLFRAGDDGEPPGTAGKPILGQIDSKQLTNITVVVVRYFGGTLLGVPGLINAYKTVTSMALQTIPVVQKNIEEIYRLQFDYTIVNDIMLILKKYNCTIIKQEMQLFCEITAGLPKSRAEEALYQLKQFHTLQIEPVLK